MIMECKVEGFSIETFVTDSRLMNLYKKNVFEIVEKQPNLKLFGVNAKVGYVAQSRKMYKKYQHL
jgi:hypothetical protein